MANQETILCTNCNTPYSINAQTCPNCGHPNPIIVENFETDDVFEVVSPRRWWRSKPGCGSIVVFLLLILAGIVWGGYDGLKEQATRRQAEIDRGYQQALAYVDNNETELAIAELNRLLTLAPANQQARELLTKLKTTPTSTPITSSEPRRNVAEGLYNQAKSLMLQGDWQQVVELLSQVRDIDPTYQPATISEALYNANYELGLRLVTENDLPGALHALDNALVERPNDPAVTTEWEKVSLYLSLDTADTTNFESTLVILNRLYNMDPGFVDVKDRLRNTYKNYGDSLASQGEWCLAQARYESALALQPDSALDKVAKDTEFRCKNVQKAALAPTPTPTTAASTFPITPTVTVTASTGITAEISTIGGNGKIYFSRFNNTDNLWEMVTIAMSTGKEQILFSNGVQPSVNSSSTLLEYHSLLPESEGIHTFNLATGEDIRTTTFAEDVLPRIGASTQKLVFASQRSGDRRWRIFTTFADGKSDAVVLTEGRTPALSPAGDYIIYQGTDPQGNNPGLYKIPATGGDATRLTTKQSDRSPAIAASGQIAFMSARNDNWDIFLLPAAGGDAVLLVSTPGNDGLPAWSPDGTQLAFVSDKDGSWGIYVANIADKTIQKVAEWGTTHPDWLSQQISWGK